MDIHSRTGPCSSQGACRRRNVVRRPVTAALAGGCIGFAEDSDGGVIVARRARGSAAAKRAGWPLLAFLPALPLKPRRRVTARTALSGLSRVPGRTPGRRATAKRPVAQRRTPGRWLRSTYTGPAGSRSYDVYLPAGPRRTVRAP